MLMCMRSFGLGLLLVLTVASEAFAQVKLAQLPSAAGQPTTTTAAPATKPHQDQEHDHSRVSEPTYKRPTVVLVMESSGGLRAASALRKALNDAGCSVLSLVEAQRKSLTPDALLTVGADNARIHVVYWDNDGRPDVLSSVGPATQDQVDAVVLALSSALIERHRTTTPAISREVMARARMFEDQKASRAIYAMLGRGTYAPRTNVYLRFEDF
jgi:hypothetical protein